MCDVGCQVAKWNRKDSYGNKRVPFPSLSSSGERPRTQQGFSLVREGLSLQNVGPDVGLTKPHLREGFREGCTVPAAGALKLLSAWDPWPTSFDFMLRSPEFFLELFSSVLVEEQTAEKSANALWPLIPSLGLEAPDQLLVPNSVTHFIKVPVINAVLLFIKWI